MLVCKIMFRRITLGFAAVLLSAVLAAGAVAAKSALSAQDQATIAEVETYLNGIETFVARFVQIDAKGGLSRGTFYLHRPGRLRFQYEPPTPLLLVSDGFWLILYDRELQQADRWPISDTPLGLLVAEKVSLRKTLKVTKVDRQPGFVRLTVIDRKNPDEGSLTLTLQTPALALRHWRVIDAQGGETNVSFTDVKRDISLKPSLFQFDEPVPFGTGKDKDN